MKAVAIKNRVIQFDSVGDNHLRNAQDLIERINEVLQREFPNEQPQIMASDLDVSDLESEDISEE